MKCYSKEDIQEILDNEYEGNLLEFHSHIKSCDICKNIYEEMKREESRIKHILESDMNMSSIRMMKAKSNILEKTRKEGFKMNKTMKRSLAAAAGLAIIGGITFVEPMRVMAEDILKIFRLENAQGISISQDDINSLENVFRKGEGFAEIKNIGQVDLKSEGEIKEYNMPADMEAAKAVFQSHKVLDLPEGYAYQHASIYPKSRITYKLDTEKTNQLLKYLGEDISLPEILNKKDINIQMDETFMYSMGNEKEYIDIVETGNPEIQIPKDIDEKELVKSILTLKLMPENLKKQLLSMEDITKVLPIPFDKEREEKKDITVNGEKAILIKAKNDKYQSIRLVWKQNGKVYFVNSSNISEEKLVSILEGMK